jgi:exodeoxyribonuclease VII large subunit
MNRECNMPRPALRIAIVSSATAAGYQDFMREVGRTPYRFRFTLFESLMQGDNAERSIINSLVAIAEREEEFDAVVIIRGGGSTSDLGIFDSYMVASSVAQFPLPIISGIGHDKDVSIVDMVAHTACKTPTAVATHLVELVDGEMALIDDLAQRLRDGIARRMANERLRLERSTADLRNLATVKLTRENLRLDALDEGIIGEARSLIAREKQRLDAAADTAEARSPERLLRLGFAVLRSAERSLRSVSQLSEGDTIQIEMADGNATAEIKTITKN